MPTLLPESASHLYWRRFGRGGFAFLTESDFAEGKHQEKGRCDPANEVIHSIHTVKNPTDCKWFRFRLEVSVSQPRDRETR